MVTVLQSKVIQQAPCFIFENFELSEWYKELAEIVGRGTQFENIKWTCGVIPQEILDNGITITEDILILLTQNLTGQNDGHITPVSIGAAHLMIDLFEKNYGYIEKKYRNNFMTVIKMENNKEK